MGRNPNYVDPWSIMDEETAIKLVQRFAGKDATKVDPEDVVQETRINLWPKQHEIAEPFRRSYIVRSLRNKTTDHLRKTAHRPKTIPLHECSEAIDVFIACSPEEDLRTLMERLIDQAALSATERRVIEERFGLNGRAPRSVKGIAAELGVSEARVYQILAAAMGKLRIAWNPDL